MNLFYWREMNLPDSFSALHHKHLEYRVEIRNLRVPLCLNMHNRCLISQVSPIYYTWYLYLCERRPASGNRPSPFPQQAETRKCWVSFPLPRERRFSIAVCLISYKHIRGKESHFHTPLPPLLSLPGVHWRGHTHLTSRSLILHGLCNWWTPLGAIRSSFSKSYIVRVGVPVFGAVFSNTEEGKVVLGWEVILSSSLPVLLYVWGRQTPFFSLCTETHSG